MKKAPTKNDVIHKYLNGDLKRFLKRVERFMGNELIYSITLNKYDEEEPGLKKQILKKLRQYYPGEICQIINIHRVMVKHYNFCFDMEDIMICERISGVMDIEISQLKLKSSKYRKTRHTKKQAIRELKARGFININDFEDYDKRFSHIVTNQQLFERGSHRKLIYPENFIVGVIKDVKWWEIPNAYIVRAGVSGYTKVSTPQNR